MAFLEWISTKLLEYGFGKVMDLVKRRRSHPNVLISCDVDRSQLSRRGDTWWPVLRTGTQKSVD